MNSSTEEPSRLADEAKARDKWRKGETLLEAGADDLGLPASESDDAAAHGRRSRGGRPDAGGPGGFPPPD